jgi:hypothetical protein
LSAAARIRRDNEKAKMKTDDLQAIGITLLQIVKPDMTPKKLLKAARKKHPKASKQDIVRAAFYTIIANADAEPEKSKKLHEFAMSERTKGLEKARPPRPLAAPSGEHT